MGVKKYYFDIDSNYKKLTKEVIQRWERDRDRIVCEVYWMDNSHICSYMHWGRMYDESESLDILWAYLGESPLVENDLKWV